MSELLIAILQAAHILCFNLTAAGPLVCIVLHFHQAKESGTELQNVAGEIGEQLAKWSFWSICLGSLLGLILLAVVWETNEAYRLTLLRFPKKHYWMAGSELFISMLFMLIYWKCWTRWKKRKWLHSFFAVFATTNILYHFPPMMSGIRKLAEYPELVLEETVSHQAFLKIWLKQDVLIFSTHVWLACFAVSGMVLAYLADRYQGQAQKGMNQETMKKTTNNSERYIQLGGWIFLIPTLLQLLVGFFVLLTIPAGQQAALMGSNLLATSLLGVSIVVSLWLMHQWTRISLGDYGGGGVKRAAGVTVLLIVVMTFAMHLARNDVNHFTG